MNGVVAAGTRKARKKRRQPCPVTTNGAGTESAGTVAASTVAERS